MATASQNVVEVPQGEPEANKLFRMVMKHKGSDLHLKVGVSPAMRLGGVLRQMQMPQLTTAEMERLMFPLLTARQRKILEDVCILTGARLISEDAPICPPWARTIFLEI